MNPKKMAFGTWFKNLLVKGKNFIKKASPYIRKGIEIARKVGPMFGDTVGGIVNSIANGADYLLNKVAPIPPKTNPIRPKPLPIDFTNFDSIIKDDSNNKVEMIQRPILGGNKGRLTPILK